MYTHNDMQQAKKGFENNLSCENKAMKLNSRWANNYGKTCMIPKGHKREPVCDLVLDREF